MLAEIKALEAKLNKPLYVLMQGLSEFGASGRLDHWDRKGDLGKLAMPILVIGAAHDTMDPAHMRWMKAVDEGKGQIAY